MRSYCDASAPANAVLGNIGPARGCPLGASGLTPPGDTACRPARDALRARQPGCDSCSRAAAPTRRLPDGGNKRGRARVYTDWRARIDAHSWSLQRGDGRAVRLQPGGRFRARGAGLPRQPVPDGPSAEPRPGRRGGSGAGHLSQGLSRRRSVRARDEPEGLVVHDSPQHGEEPVPRSRAGHGRRRQRRRRSRRRRAAAGVVGRRPPDTPETLLLRDTLAPELQAAIDALPEAFREAVWLRDVEEFSYAEIAEMLDVPIGTVMSRISRGRHLLVRTVEPDTRAAALRADSRASEEALAE